MIIDDEIWVTLSRYLISLLKAKYKEKHNIEKFEYEDMVKLLAKNGTPITNVALRKKVSRGRFSAQFLLQLILALDVDLSSSEIKDVLNNSRVILSLINNANANRGKGGDHALIANMLRVAMNVVELSGQYPQVNRIREASLVFPYRSVLSEQVANKLNDDDLFTLSLFDELPHEEKDAVMKAFGEFLFSGTQKA